MWSGARIATSLLSIAAITVIVALLALGSGDATPAAPPCGSAADAVTRTATLAVAKRLRDEELTSPTVSRDRHTIESDRILAAAVARGDAAAARREALVLLFDHEHIVRLRVLRSGTVLADVGGKLVLTPVWATLRLGGRLVGSVEFSVQDDMGYRLLTKRLVGVSTVMRYRGRTLMADIDVGGRALPRTGAVRVSGARYLVATVTTGHFPDGVLRISLLIPAPPAALARASCAQARTEVLAGVVRRVYEESVHGPAAAGARAAVASSVLLPAAIAAGDRARAQTTASRLLRPAHGVRIAALDASGRVVATAGITAPALAPLAVPLRRYGATVGRALIAIESARSFVDLSSYLSGAVVFVRTPGGNPLAGRVGAGPATIPASGAVSWDGRPYHVASFAATRFPSGRVTVYALVRDA
jgi:hypothetical protein